MHAAQLSIQDAIEEGTFRMKHWPGSNNVADIFTKWLPRNAVQRYYVVQVDAVESSGACGIGNWDAPTSQLFSASRHPATRFVQTTELPTGRCQTFSSAPSPPDSPLLRSARLTRPPLPPPSAALLAPLLAGSVPHLELDGGAPSLLVAKPTDLPADTVAPPAVTVKPVSSIVAPPAVATSWTLARCTRC